jgi:PTH1 family peptidyl-tRNA hydrolase
VTERRVVIGLGNPGARYADTRHNVGFRVLDELAGRHAVTFARPSGSYEVATVEQPGAIWILLKPLTYMNRSGDALRDWAADCGARFPAVPATPSDEDPAGPGESAAPRVDPLVVCDDLALPLGALRIRPGGSAGGQKGLASLIAAVGSENIPRVRLGIGDPDRALPAEAWSDFVLSAFAPHEMARAEELVQRAADAVELVLREGVIPAAERCNRRRPPDEPEVPPPPEGRRSGGGSRGKLA